MEKSFLKILQGYNSFRDKYVHGDTSILKHLSDSGQRPKIMVVSCCDSRVDPALILQCDPGDLYVVRNVANIVPPFQKDEGYHGTSASIEFGIRFLNIEHLILLGHSQCGGIKALLNKNNTVKYNDFITSWVSVLKDVETTSQDIDEYAKASIKKSYENCLSFPWILDKIKADKLFLHQWFFDIKTGEIITYCDATEEYQPLTLDSES